MEHDTFKDQTRSYTPEYRPSNTANLRRILGSTAFSTNGSILICHMTLQRIDGLTLDRREDEGVLAFVLRLRVLPSV